MSIVATCLCGKLFRVPDENAGQMMSCPICSKPVLIPSLEIGRSEKVDKLPLVGQHRCVDCGEPKWAAELIDDKGDLVCQRCYDHGPPRKPLPPRVRNALLISAGVLALIGLNAAMAYYFFVVNG